MRTLLAIGMFLVALLGGVEIQAQSNIEKAREFLVTRDYANAAPYLVAAAKEAPKDLGILRLTAETYLELEKVDTALKYYSKALKVDDENLTTLNEYAYCLARLNRFDEALEAIDDAFDVKDDHVATYLTKAEIHILQNELTLADHAIRKAQTLDTESPATFVALGDLYFAQNVRELAKDNYEEALSRDSSLLEPRVKLARVYYAMANRSIDKDQANELFKKSLVNWDKVTKQDTNNAPAFFEKGKILYLAGRYPDAARALLRFTQLRPSDQLSRWYLAQSFYEINEVDSAIRYLSYARDNIDSVSEKASLYLARANYRGKRFTDAAQLFASIKQERGLAAEDLERFGRSAILSGDTTAAIENLRASLDEKPNCQLQLMYGNVLRSTKLYDEAIEAFYKTIEVCGTLKDKDMARVYFFIGISNFSRNSLDSAITALEESLRLDSTNTFARIRLGLSYKELDSLDQALSTFQRASDYLLADTANLVKNARQIENANTQIAGMLYKQKKIKALKAACKDWIQFNPKSEYGHLYLAIAYQSEQDTGNACKSYKQVLQINPESSVAKQNRKALSCP